MFHQIEGLVIDKGITMADLKGTLETFVKGLYGEDCVVRFRPHHFPFTEPSCELDVQCFKCHGKGCPTCKGEGWIELLGAGMVHPKSAGIQLVISCKKLNTRPSRKFSGTERIPVTMTPRNTMRMIW